MSEVMYTETRPKRLGRFASEMGGYLELYGDWAPGHSPDDAAAILLNVAGYLENVEVPLEEAKRIAMQDTQERFDTETTPDGEPWARLSEDYRHYKVEVEGYPDMILQRTELLKDVATSEHPWKIIGPALVFDPFVLPKDDGFNYGMLHQEGSGGGFETLPHLEFVPGKGPVEVGRKQFAGVPARPFIGLSDEAVAKIAAVFDAWSGSIPFDVGGGMGELLTGTNILGEFPIMGMHGRQPILRTPRGPRFGAIPG